MLEIKRLSLANISLSYKHCMSQPYQNLNHMQFSRNRITAQSTVYTHMHTFGKSLVVSSCRIRGVYFGFHSFEHISRLAGIYISHPNGH